MAEDLDGFVTDLAATLEILDGGEGLLLPCGDDAVAQSRADTIDAGDAGDDFFLLGIECELGRQGTIDVDLAEAESAVIHLDGLLVGIDQSRLLRRDGP